MKAITLTNLFINFIGFIMIARALFLAYVLRFKIIDRSITFFLAKDKQRFEVLIRTGLWILCLFILLNMSYLVNRVLVGFPPYLSAWVTITSLLYHGCIAAIAAIALLMYDQNLANFRFKRRKNGKQPL